MNLLDLAKFFERIDESGECWLWTGAKTKGGYANFTVYPRRTCYAHRASYEHFVGPIPEGLFIDHLCRVRHCVNPAHLEAVTMRENLLRSPVTMTSRNAARTHCNHGHEFTPENTYWKSGWRSCRRCHLDRDQRKRDLTARLGTSGSVAFVEKLGVKLV
jgi:hypothetical protein